MCYRDAVFLWANLEVSIFLVPSTRSLWDFSVLDHYRKTNSLFCFYLFFTNHLLLL